MTFNIGQQNAGVVNNVAGDQTIHGDQTGSLVLDVARGRDLLAQLRREIDSARLPADARTAVERELDGCDSELTRQEPDPTPLRDRLARVAEILGAAGAIVSAGTGLGGALVALAGWLGRFGGPLLRALPRR